MASDAAAAGSGGRSRTGGAGLLGGMSAYASGLFAERVDGASLAVVRVLLGILICVDAVRKGDYFFSPNEGRDYVFRYDWFHWLPESPEAAAYLKVLLFVCGACVAAGLVYRLAMVTATLLITYGFLLAEEYYLNHYYLLILVCLLFAACPANRVFALDRLIFGGARSGHTVAAFYLLLARLQVEIVLLYAGLVKINEDWLRLEPLRTWLLDAQDEVFFGAIWQYDWAVAVGAYGSIALHIIGAPLLFWKRTRMPVFLLYVGFHLTNHFVFNIGIFPWMTIALTTLFFDPDWPRRLLGLQAPHETGAAALANPVSALSRRQAALLTVGVLWLGFQALFPLRHYFYPGDVAWTYEAHKFSWRMKLIDRWSPGFVMAVLVPERDLVIFPRLEWSLSRRQYRKVSTRPGMMRQLANQVAERYRERYGTDEVAVHVIMPVGYNNRRPVYLIDPTVDLGAERPGFGHSAWLNTVNTEPLRHIEEVMRDAGGWVRPTFAEALETIGFPAVDDCRSQGQDREIRCTIAK